MKRLLYSLSVLMIMFSTTGVPVMADGHDVQRPHRKRVAVVLSGGGAKGAAHAKALQVIEEAGIPIDIVVGTSMGSIVGALYASGYTTHQLDSLVRSQDWTRLLTDSKGRDEMMLDQKLVQEKYIVHASFEKSPFEVLEGGVLKGNNIARFFTDLTADHPDSMSFRKLPIPFACVATDIVSGKEIDMYSGILAESMRSSMAIPGVFAPVRKNGMVLVDGGLVNNYPVDIAKGMGADIIIGVDVTDKDKKAEEINSTASVLMRILDVICANKYKENVENTDVHIRVDVSGYSSASFSSSAIDSLLKRGEDAARAKWDDLIALKSRIGHIGRLAERKPKVIDCDTVVIPVSTIYNGVEKNSFIGLGARFDNEELATMILGGEYELNREHKFKAGMELRLGRRYYGRLTSQIVPFRKWTIGGMYQYGANETKLYNRGEYMANLDYREHKARLFFRRGWRKMLVTFGSEYVYGKYASLLTHSDWVDFAQKQKDENSISYYAQIEFDNQDASVMPRKGMKWCVKYNYFTDNGYRYNGGYGLNIVEGYMHMALPVSERFTLIPSVAGRIIPNRNEHLNNLNFIGGIDTYGHYMQQQIPFAGVNYMQIAPNDILVAGIRLRHNLTTNNYIFGIMNYGLSGNAIQKLVTIDSNNLFGAALGYGYRSPVGPVEVQFNWSSITRSVGSFLNIGYMF